MLNMIVKMLFVMALGNYGQKRKMVTARVFYLISSLLLKNKGWYRVSYRDMGHKGVTDVKVVEKMALSN